MPQDVTLPNYRRPEADACAHDLTLIHDLLGGTRPMHRKAPVYIAKWPAEDEKVFEIRSRCETVFEGLGRTLSAATGMLFAKPPKITWNASEATIKPHYDNLDAAGTKGSVLIKRFAEAAMRDGLGGILVDHTPVPVGEDKQPIAVVTDQMEQELGLRPTWALYARSQIINWRHATINNQRTLTMVVLHETADVEDGPYGIKTVHRWRELRLILTPDGYQGTWKVTESDTVDCAKAEEFRFVGSGAFKNRAGKVAPFLPFSVAYTGRTDAPMTATIPLLGVAWANLAHWQQSTDLRFYRWSSAYPQPTVTGALAPDAAGNAQKLRLGPFVAVHLSDPNAKFAWEEIEGKSMDQLEKGIAEKLRQMSMLGMAFLSGDTRRAAETAEAKRLDATAENSTLATSAQGNEDCVNASFEHHAWYLGIAKIDAPVLEINRDFESTVIDPQTMTAYVQAVALAGLPPRILLEAWLAGGRLPPETDIDALLAEMMANQAAIEDQKAQALKDAQAITVPHQLAA